LLNRRRFKQTQTLEQRLAVFAQDARLQADRLEPGPEKDALLQKAREADTASHLSDWVGPQELPPPK
jgi:hypothetical protein